VSRYDKVKHIYFALDVSEAAFSNSYSLINRRVTKHHEIN
jgi:hypothetical protein